MDTLVSSDNELDPLPPRYFIIHKDGSGEELLQYADIKEHLEKAEKNPCTAVLKSDTEGTKAVSGITILQPFPGKCLLCMNFDRGIRFQVPKSKSF